MRAVEMWTPGVGVPGMAAARARVVEAEGWTGLGIVDSQLPVRRPVHRCRPRRRRDVDHADAVTFAVGVDPDRLGRAVAHARAACVAAGRDPDALGLGTYVPLFVHDDRALARHTISGSVGSFARFSVAGAPCRGATNSGCSWCTSDRKTVTLDLARRLARSCTA